MREVSFVLFCVFFLDLYVSWHTGLLAHAQEDEMATEAPSASADHTQLRAPFDKKDLLKNLTVFHQMSEVEIKKHIRDSLYSPQGSYVLQILDRYPTLMTIFARTLKDKDAIYSLSLIPHEKGKLYKYGFFFLGLMLFSWILKYFLCSKDPFFLRLIKRLFITIFIIMCQIGSGIYVFWHELSPFLRIVENAFLGGKY